MTSHGFVAGGQPKMKYLVARHLRNVFLSQAAKQKVNCLWLYICKRCLTLLVPKLKMTTVGMTFGCHVLHYIVQAENQQSVATLFPAMLMSPVAQLRMTTVGQTYSGYVDAFSGQTQI